MTTRPRIGVTRWDDVPDEARDRYWARVVEAGGEVVDIAEPQAADAHSIIPTLDALILTGGIDVDPSIYGAERHAKVKEVDRGRDEMELAYLSEALIADLPVLAICRGHQVLNVGFGGKLLQHVDSGEHRADYRTPGYPSRWHSLRIEADSRLGGIFGTGELEINSRHHQAVTADVLGDGLRPVAFSDDHGGQLIEGIESTQHRWVVGVQWHPERLEEERVGFAPSMRKLYAALMEQARNR
jgi:gamma-glutamyl-gamma-aminobutyrate hydrolase PuuD